MKDTLLSKYNYRIELHAHTSPASGCSRVPPKEVVQFYKDFGYDAIVITNHFTYKGDKLTKEEFVDLFVHDYEEAREYGEECGVKVYLGAEIRFTESSNDYLVFGVNKEMLLEIYDYLEGGLENFRKNYAMPESVFIQAHPMRNGMQLVDPTLLDGIEVYNMHPGHNSKIGLASLYAKENNFSIITAGTDFHYPEKEQVGLGVLRSACLPADSFGIAELLKSEDYLLEIGRKNIVIP